MGRNSPRKEKGVGIRQGTREPRSEIQGNEQTTSSSKILEGVKLKSERGHGHAEGKPRVR